MSKVKLADVGIKKSKLMAGLRRKETFNKKKNRLEKCRNNAYAFGYYIDDKKVVRHYKTVLVPEHMKETFKFSGYEKVIIRDHDGRELHSYMKPRLIKVDVVVPEHYERVCIKTEYVATPIKLKPANSHIKRIRKMFERHIRRRPLEETYNGGSYRKLNNARWELD